MPLLSAAILRRRTRHFAHGLSERYRLLADFLQAQDPAEVTPGYRALAALCADRFFDLVLTTNLDPLLDDALADARLWRRDYLLLVNGIIRADRVAPLLRAGQPRVKVIKLHGDLLQRSMAWTPAEMDQFVKELTPALEPAIAGRDVLIVGQSLRDERIRELMLKTAGERIWYATPRTVPSFIAQEPRLRSLTGDDGGFEKLFPGLAAILGLAVHAEVLRETPEGVLRGPMEPRPVGAETMDDLAASVVGLAHADRAPAMTGFVLCRPHVIVTDGWSGNVQQLGAGEISAITQDGRRLRTSILRHVSDHPFGPLFLTVPADLAVPGLQLDGTPLSAGVAVHIAVAAGERVGLSSGTVGSGRGVTIQVTPIGEVTNIIRINAAVSPGSSGAPVVDAKMAVRGFIVAGSVDPKNPESYLYPASRWANYEWCREYSPSASLARARSGNTCSKPPMCC
jgi:hypothetical protein